MAAGVSRDELVGQAQEAARLLGDNFQKQAATAEVAKLIGPARSFICQEVVQRPECHDSYTPILVALNRALDPQEVQKEVPFLTKANTAQRMFAELAWFQDWRRGQMPTDESTRTETNRLAKRTKQMFSEETAFDGEQRRSVVDLRFEACCALQAAKCLAPPGGIWKQFASPSATVAGGGIAAAAGANAKFGSLFSALKKIVDTVRKEWVASWYIDVWSTRWLAERVTTVDGFNEDIGEECVRSFCEAGNKYSLCIATIFWEMLNREGAEEGLKNRLIMGGAGSPGLLGLLEIKPSYSLSDLAQTVKDTGRKLARKTDRFWETRSLVMMRLGQLLQDPSFAKWHAAIRGAIRARMVYLQGKESKRYIEERGQLKALDKPDELQALQQQLEMIALMGPSKGPEDEAKETRAKELEQIQAGIEIGDTLEAMENDEEALLRELLGEGGAEA